jgi:Zn-finger protein
MACDFCFDRGWGITYGYDSINEQNNGYHIEKCDDCAILKSDSEARRNAFLYLRRITDGGD